MGRSQKVHRSYNCTPVSLRTVPMILVETFRSIHKYVIKCLQGTVCIIICSFTQPDCENIGSDDWRGIKFLWDINTMFHDLFQRDLNLGSTYTFRFYCQIRYFLRETLSSLKRSHWRCWLIQLVGMRDPRIHRCVARTIAILILDLKFQNRAFLISWRGFLQGFVVLV